MTHNTREVEDIHKWEFLKEDKYHETWRSEYCGEIQVQKALADHIRHHQLQKARHDWLREEIGRLEAEKRNANFRLERDKPYTTYELSEYIQNCCADTGFNQALQTIIDRYQAELDQDKQ